MEYVALWLFCGIVSAAIASGRGRSGCAWLLLGVLFGPFGFVVALMPRIEDTRGTVKCPFCAELVRSEAVKCKHCGSDLPLAGAVPAGTCPTCRYIFNGKWGSEGWWCPNCKKVYH